MTTQEQQTESETAGAPSSPDTLSRSNLLATAFQSELRGAVATCLLDAEAKGYTKAELGASFLGGEKLFDQITAGAPLSLLEAIELARVCGFRLRVSVEAMDDEVQTPAHDIATPFETASRWAANHALLKHIQESDREELIRQVLALYFSVLREKGFYIGRRPNTISSN